MKNTIQSFPITVANGQSGNTIRITPQAGRVIGCCIYHVNTDGAINAGIVRGKFSTDSGDEIVPMVDLRHYRNRETAYNDGAVPLDFDTAGRTYNFQIAAAEPFTGDFTADLVLLFAPENC